MLLLVGGRKRLNPTRIHRLSDASNVRRNLCPAEGLKGPAADTEISLLVLARQAYLLP